jgi:excisionase family DNA binding protein
MTMPKKLPSDAASSLSPNMLVPLADRLSVSPEQASALTGIGISRIREAIRDGALGAHRNGASIVILPDDIKVWLRALPPVETKKDSPD